MPFKFNVSRWNILGFAATEQLLTWTCSNLASAMVFQYTDAFYSLTLIMLVVGKGYLPIQILAVQ